MNQRFTQKHPWFLAFIALAIGILVGYVAQNFSSSSSSSSSSLNEVRDFQNAYHFINPLLACGNDNFSQISNEKTLELERVMQQIIDDKKAKGAISEGAVYFRELNGGLWIGIHENTLFTPGSLLKVPLVMSVYKHAEKDPGFLEKKIMYEGGVPGAEQHFVSKILEPGTYSVNDLIRATLVDSDNAAAVLLGKLISPEELNESYSHLGITTPTRGEDYTMPVKIYSSFFRILYDATYLEREPSEHMLSLLSESTFRDGIVAGVPSGAIVAHKFGERSIEGTLETQLHDCGIVYHSKQPYLLCVMMRGKEPATLAGVIRDISKVAYTYAE